MVDVDSARLYLNPHASEKTYSQLSSPLILILLIHVWKMVYCKQLLFVLNVCVFTITTKRKIICLNPKAQEDGIRKGLGYEGSALMNGISALKEET
jgi:hypothetical protein